MSICASCKQHGVNTFAYIRDMLVRVSTGPVNRIRELLPDRWKAERDAANREVAAAGQADCAPISSAENH